MNNLNQRLATATLIVATGLCSLSGAFAGTVPPTVNISQQPLFSGRGNVHPNLVLDLSVEYPTVGTAYRSGYNKSTEYLGYFNPNKCYTYPSSNLVYTATGILSNGTKYYSKGTTPVYQLTNLNPVTGSTGSLVGYLTKPSSGTYTTYTAGTNTHFTGTTQSSVSFDVPDLTDADGYFRISGDANSNHECSGAFSGNFLNWATSSSIDMLRYALTGGDRVVDTASKTVLQRAYLPDGSYNSNSSFYANSSYFPRRTVSASAASGNSVAVTAPNTVTPFNTSTLYVVSCRDRILFSNTNNSGNNCDTKRIVASGSTATLATTDKYYGEYFARVQVCDSQEGSTRTDLCSKYGNNYKPEGNLQRYSEKVRSGAFGYLTEYNSGYSVVYGGVLRAPVKYVGAKKFEAPGFAEANNDMPEWDKDTGVFYPDPIGSPKTATSSGNSGVINYLNKFGRTNTSRLGAYKGNDPVTELYYESLRYLQGKGPTNGSTAGTSAFYVMGTNTNDDAFPVYKTWAASSLTSTTAPDPIIAACQNNYVLLIGDVNTWDDNYIPGSSARGNDAARAADTATTQWPALNAVTQTQKVGQMESSSTYGNSAPRTNLANLETLNTGASNSNYYMAGLAYWANTTDIRLDKPTRVRTFTIDVDEGGNGSIEDTNPRGTKPRNSAFYLAAKYGGFVDRGDSTASDTALRPDGNPFKTFDTDGKTVLTNNNEWTGTPTGTNPTNYFLASQPEKLIAAINNIFTVVASNSGTISGVTLTSTRISTDSSYVYQPGFDTAKWGGTLLKQKMSYDADTNKVTIITNCGTSCWDAGVILTGKAATTNPVSPAVAANPTDADRKIYTAKVNADGSLTTVEFKWSTIDSGQKTYLQQSPISPYADEGATMGEKRLNYLRGSRTDEIGYTNGIFRARDRVLGDIINSNPTWVGPPAAYVRGDDYSTFYENNKGRTPAVYVGANDGMLHAFRASDGVELFAYAPNALFPYLNQLTDSAYSHRPYVDGQMNVLEAKVSGNWKTILVSGFGGGAQGLFVLDITNPDSFSSGSGAIWEFTDANDPYIGNLMSPPVVAKFKTGTDTDGNPVYKSFVVVASGYNNYSSDSNSTATITGDEGKGALFLLSLDKAPGDSWTLGTNYYRLKTPVSDSTLPNGLSTPALVVGNDGAVRYAYTGDLQGNLWRFDFTGNASAWAAPSTPLFIAKDSSGKRQPITQEPKVVFAPGGGYVVLFGTGKFVEDADKDPTKFQTQSFYAIYDNTYDTVTGRSQLAQRTLTTYNTGYTIGTGASAITGTNDAFKVSGSVFSYGVPSTAKPNNKMGWYMDFSNSGTASATNCASNSANCGTGERSVTNALTAYGNLFFNTLVTGTNPCAKGGGRTYGVCVLSGFPFNSSGDCITDGTGVTGFISEVGMLSSPVLFDVGTTIGDRDSIGQRNVQKKYAVFNFGTGGSAGTAAAAKASDGKDFTGSFSTPAGRISWREVLNYDEMRKTTGN
ncbi:MAG: pilus assembly protein PilY [Burkholderiaceae bacterium]|nr:pilus assembly protein PilY [Burkholderiaceae bacterium]